MCVRSSFRKRKLSESRMCITFEFCEKWHFIWTSIFLWKSWTVLSFFLNFSYVRISFQTNVDLNFQNSYVDFRLYRARFDLDRDCEKLMSNRSFFAKFVYSFQIWTIFIRAFIVNQNVHIICVFQRLCINFEFIAHFQQIDILKQIKNEKQRRFLKSFCLHWKRSNHCYVTICKEILLSSKKHVKRTHFVFYRFARHDDKFVTRFAFVTRIVWFTKFDDKSIASFSLSNSSSYMKKDSSKEIWVESEAINQDVWRSRFTDA
jgi:hypothetical protein